MIYTLDLRNLRRANLRKGLTKCRDGHEQARPMICVSFWAIPGSLCVSISLFVSHSLFFLYRHRLGPVHKRADRLERPFFLAPKNTQKMKKKPSLFGFFLFCLCFVRIIPFYGSAIDTGVRGKKQSSPSAPAVLLLCCLPFLPFPNREENRECSKSYHRNLSHIIKLFKVFLKFKTFYIVFV